MSYGIKKVKAGRTLPAGDGTSRLVAAIEIRHTILKRSREEVDKSKS
jgi:hypothetical protein